MKDLFTLLFLLILFLPALGEVEDPLVHRFSFIGCNRVGFEVDVAKNPSTANIEQLKNTFREFARNEPRPSHLFFVGDLILGYTGYLSCVDQLEAWKHLYESSELARSSIRLVPIVGNHEVLLSVQNAQKQWSDYPNPPAVLAWNDVMEPLLHWRDGPTNSAPNKDSLTMDQSTLSFTVRHENLLFIILNTDTFVDNTTIGDIPLHWLEEKLKEGEGDETVDHIFVLGHKPLLKPDMDAWIVREEERGPARRLLAESSKVRAFLTSHYHFWDCREMPEGVPQVIAGNGGSPLKGPFTDPEVGYFGYSVVNIYRSGRIEVESWGRPVPDPYSSREPQPPATLRETRVLWSGER